LARIFIYDGKELPDPDPALKVDEVRQSLTQYFPELSNAETKETKRGEDQVFTFAKRVGTKGCN
jgi:PRTRC genetic system protein C